MSDETKASGLKGMLKRKGKQPVSTEEMNNAVQHVCSSMAHANGEVTSSKIMDAKVCDAPPGDALMSSVSQNMVDQLDDTNGVDTDFEPPRCHSHLKLPKL